MPSSKEVATFTFDGHRYYVRAESKEEAKILARIKKNELEQGRLYKETTLSVDGWFDQYMETYKADVLPKTKEDYYVFYRNAIKPYIGHLPLKSVKPIHCQNILNKCSSRSASYIHKVSILLKGMFSAAVDNELINKNPAIRAAKPNKDGGTRRPLTKDERIAFIKASTDIPVAGLFCRIIYFCGLRPSEVNRIRGGDYTNTMLKVRGTKTAASNRTVPIPSALALPKVPKGELLFPLREGGERDAAGSRRYWLRIRHQMSKYTKVGEDLTLYCLRHDYCTRLQEAGVPIDVARRIMGHSSVEVTSRIYTHESETTLLSALSMINGVAPPVAPNP